MYRDLETVLARRQHTFCPVDFNFVWTADGWYSWDRPVAIKAARRERDAMAKSLRAAGRKVTVFTLPEQRITRGGIGSGKPELDFCVSVYGLNVA